MLRLSVAVFVLMLASVGVAQAYAECEDNIHYYGNAGSPTQECKVHEKNPPKQVMIYLYCGQDGGTISQPSTIKCKSPNSVIDCQKHRDSGVDYMRCHCNSGEAKYEYIAEYGITGCPNVP